MLIAMLLGITMSLSVIGGHKVFLEYPDSNGNLKGGIRRIAKETAGQIEDLTIIGKILFCIAIFLAMPGIIGMIAFIEILKFVILISVK